MKFQDHPFLVIILIALLSLPFATSSVAVSLDEYIKDIYPTHPKVKAIQLDQFIQEYEVLKAQSVGEWELQLKPNARYTEPISMNAFTASKQQNLGLNLSLNRRFLDSGRHLSILANSTQLNQSFPANNLGFEMGKGIHYQQDVKLQLTQPLFRNERCVSELPLLLAKERQRWVQLQSKTQLTGLLLEVIQHYLDWVLYSEQVKLSERRLEIAQTQRRAIQERLNDHLVEKVDLIRSEDTLRLLIQQHYQYESLLDSKRHFINTYVNEQLSESDIPSYDLESLPLPLSPDQIELTNLPSVAQQALVLKQVDHQRKATETRLRPQVDMQIGAGLSGADSEWSDSFGISAPELSVQWVYHRQAKQASTLAEMGILTAKHSQAKAQMDSQAQDALAILNSLYVQFDWLSKLITLQRAQISASQNTVQEEKTRYFQGRTPLTNLIQAQDSEQQAKLNLLLSQIQYHRLYNQYQAASHTLALPGGS